ncbi:MAG: hypothetical protein Q9M39_07695 [Sulfurovum sp.]|nr:hypothetical protein [Sulfurovum sp.]
MIKMTNVYLIGLLATGLLVGCGSSNSENNEAYEGGETNQQVEANDGIGGETNQQVEANDGIGGEMPVTPPTTSAKTFTADVMPALEAKCKSCHGDNGNFTITTASGTYANISDLKASVREAGKYLYDKGSNTVGHGGGETISTTSTEYATIKSWVDSGADFN